MRQAALSQEPPGAADELVQIAREARQKGWWHPYSTVLTGAYVGNQAPIGVGA